MKESTNVVFILGAGASADYGPPVMSNFMNTARRRWAKLHAHGSDADDLRSCYDALLSFYEDCRASTWAFKRDWENMEELYTQADLRRLASAPGSKQAEGATDLCNRIAWTIWDVYRECETRLPLWTICGRVRNAGLRPVIVTTNYDLVCEAARGDERFPKARLFYPGLGYLDGATRAISEDNGLPTPGEDACTVPIIKLHGSVNWFFSRQEEKWIALPDTELFRGEGRSWGTIRDNVVQRASEALPEWRECPPSSIAPGIIPPMLGKTSLSNVITQQWRAAIDAIAAARHIWVIGYSFPSTDAFMTRLLTEGMRRNGDFERLVIVDIQPWSAWKSRVQQTFGAMLAERKLSYLSRSAAWMYQDLQGPSSSYDLRSALQAIRYGARRAFQESGDWAFG